MAVTGPRQPLAGENLGPETEPPSWRPWLNWGVKLGLSGLVLWLALRNIPLAGILSAVRQVEPRLALGSVLLYALGAASIESARLAFSGRLVAEPRVGYGGWLRLFMVSRPFFYFLPASAGAEGRVWLGLRRRHWRHGSCGFALLLNRSIGVGGWALAAAFALSYPGGTGLMLRQAPTWLRSPWPWGIGGGCVLAACLLAPSIHGLLRALPSPPGQGRSLLGLALTTLASILVTALAALMAAAAAGTPLTLDQALGLIAIFNFAMVLPISLGGFGLQEALVLSLGLGLGYPPAALIAFSTLLHAQRLVLSLAGLGLMLAGSEDPVPAPRP